MERTTKIIVAAGTAVVLVAAGASYAVASGGGDDSEPPITGTDLEKASAAALAATGGGRVTETEVGDEESWYEVEVTLDDGSQVDVQLDRSFAVVSSETDRSPTTRRRLSSAARPPALETAHPVLLHEERAARGSPSTKAVSGESSGPPGEKSLRL